MYFIVKRSPLYRAPKKGGGPGEDDFRVEYYSHVLDGKEPIFVQRSKAPKVTKELGEQCVAQLAKMYGGDWRLVAENQDPTRG